LHEIPWVRKRLYSRVFFSLGNFLTIKLLEQWLRSASHVVLNKPQIVCVHGERFFGLLPILFVLKLFGFIERILWDQRELTTAFLGGNTYKLKVLKWLISLCDGVAMANIERKEIVTTALILNQKLEEKIYCIANYPDLNFLNLQIESTTVPTATVMEQIKHRYIYLQSPTEPERFFHNTVEAVLNHNNIQLLVSGRVSNSDRATLVEKFGKIIEQKVIFIGLIDPYHLPVFMDNALASCVFYDKSSLNRMYCAPNRLYQSISRGVPVLVGDNPPLKNIVEQTQSGVVIDGDGSDSKVISEGISRILGNEKKLRESARISRMFFSWESQSNTIKDYFLGKSA
jgi:glycosyltransferase involved in cell wall biosynthesis